MRRPSARRMPVARPAESAASRCRRSVSICTTSAPVSMTTPLGDGEPLDRADDLGEAAARVEHALVEVEVAHQVVQARHAVGRAAEEDSGVAEDLAQPRVGEPPLDVRGERAGEQRRELRQPAQQRGVAQARRRLVRVVEEAGDREVVRVRRRSRGRRRAARPAPGSMLSNSAVAASRPETTSSGASPSPARSTRGTPGRGGTRSSSLCGGRAEQAEEVVEHLGHEVPARAGVEAEAVVLPRSRAAADVVARLEQRHRPAVGGEQRRGGETGDAAADDDRAPARGRRGARHARALPRREARARRGRRGAP